MDTNGLGQENKHGAVFDTEWGNLSSGKCLTLCMSDTEQKLKMRKISCSVMLIK